MSIAKRVLVVDDNANNVEVIHEILDGDYDVIDAANGWEALEIAERLAPQFVLLDVMLPIIDGYEVCRKMRQLPGMKRARIIMVSAKAMPSERRHGLDAGADDYLTKPFDDGELLSLLRQSERAYSASHR
jgi:two-component system, cell cycle response regulator